MLDAVPDSSWQWRHGYAEIEVPREHLLTAARSLRGSGYDYLSFITEVDWKDRLEVLYHLYAYDYKAQPLGAILRTKLPREGMPALASVTTELPAVLSRRMDPTAGVSVVWGSLHAGSAPNVIPDHGIVTGTVRILDAVAWADCEEVVRTVVDEIVRPYGVSAEIDYQRGVPPVVNEPVSNRILADAVRVVLGDKGQVVAPQSLGGEDFGWYLERVPGAMMRLGTRTPGGATYDLHQGNLRIDERAIGIGAKLLAQTATRALRR